MHLWARRFRSRNLRRSGALHMSYKPAVARRESTSASDPFDPHASVCELEPQSDDSLEGLSHLRG